MHPRVRSFFICLSIANLLFAEAWIRLHFGFSARRLKGPITAFHAALLVDVVLLALAFFAIDSVLGQWRWRPVARRLGLLVCFLLFLKSVTGMSGYGWLSQYLALFSRGAFAFVGASLLAMLAVGTIGWFALFPKPMRLLGILALGLSPLFAINLWLAARALVLNGSRFDDLPPVTGSKVRAGPRVIWIILDTLDYHYTFEEHPGWLKLPALDRLRSESVDFSYALAPGPRTEISIPSFLTGKLYIDQAIISPNDYKMTLMNGQTEHFRGQPTVFGDAEKMGARTALVGFHLPYGRLIGDQLSYCRWWQWPTDFGSDQPWIDTAVQMFAYVPSKPFTNRLMIERQIQMHEQEIVEAEKLLAEKKYRLEFFHLFPPHEPPMYNGLTHRYEISAPRMVSSDARGFWREGYFHSLALADDSFAELRREMERDGTWRNSLVIVTADHSWRLADLEGYKIYPRIPFLCHFPGQKARVPSPEKINTLLVHDLLLDYLKGSIKGPQELVGWVHRWTASHPEIPLSDDPPNYAKSRGSD